MRPRVEALDCRNYAYAAMLLAEPNLGKFAGYRTESGEKPGVRQKRKIQIGNSSGGLMR
jgi:phage terminase large subunit GpA-like protein